jgi:hypothetical protein
MLCGYSIKENCLAFQLSGSTPNNDGVKINAVLLQRINCEEEVKMKM